MSSKWLRLPPVTPIGDTAAAAQVIADRRACRVERAAQRAAERAAMAMSVGHKPHSITCRPVPVPAVITHTAAAAVEISPAVAALRAELKRAMSENDTGGASLASLAWVARVKDDLAAQTQRETARAATDEALRAAENVLRQRRDSQSVGEAHPAYAQSLLDVAELHRQRGYPERCLLWLQKHADRAQRLHGNEHPVYAAALFGIAVQHDAMLNFEKALPLLVKAGDVQRRVLGPDSPEYIATAGHLTAMYEKIGREPMGCLNSLTVFRMTSEWQRCSGDQMGMGQRYGGWL